MLDPCAGAANPQATGPHTNLLLPLQARPNVTALFVPAEITTYAYYTGQHKQYTVANSIFRMGGAAAVLSNKRAYARTAKYELQYNVRVHIGQDDDAYR